MLLSRWFRPLVRLSRRVSAGFHRSRGCSFGWERGDVDQCCVGGGTPKAARKLAASWRAQGQVAGMRIVRLRWPRMMRAAVCSQPVAQGFGFGFGQWPVEAQQP
jgi:hypothetical protein